MNRGGYNNQNRGGGGGNQGRDGGNYGAGNQGRGGGGGYQGRGGGGNFGGSYQGRGGGGNFGGGRGAPRQTTYYTKPLPQSTVLPFEQLQNLEISPREGSSKLLINSYDLQLPLRSVFQYELEFFAYFGANGEKEVPLDRLPEKKVMQHLRRECLTTLYFLLLEQHAAYFEANKMKADGKYEHVYAYDRAKIFYCTLSMHVCNKQNAFVIDVTNLNAELFGSLHMPKRVIATLKQTRELNPESVTSDQALETYMEIVFGQHQYDSPQRFVKLDTKVYDLSTRNDLGGGCELKLGHQKGVRVIVKKENDEKIGQLQIDAKISPFYTPLPLLQYLRAKWNYGPNDDLASAHNVQILTVGLKGIFVRTTHKPVNEVFRIHGVTNMGANRMTFAHNGAEMNIAAYFAQRYYELEYPHFPCVIKKTPSGVPGQPKFAHFPLEVLVIEKGQKFPKDRMNPDQEGVMIRASQRTPLVLMTEIENQKNLASINNNDTNVKAAQMSVNNEMNIIDAEILCAPMIKFRSSGKEVNFAEWDLRDIQLVSPVTVNAFIVLYNQISQNDVQNFVLKLLKCARDLGMEFGNYDFHELKTNTLDTQSLEQIIVKYRDDYQVSYVLAVVPGTPFHHTLKATEVNTGVVTQQVEPKTASNPKLGGVTLGNIVLKMNPKNGGYNQHFGQVAPSNVNGQAVDVYQSFMKDTMVMGFYMSHPSPGNTRTGEPSVCGYSFSINDLGNVGRGGFLYTRRLGFDDGNVGKDGYPKSESSSSDDDEASILSENELLKPLGDAAKLYYETNGRYPERVLVYRFGTSDGEIEKIRTDESWNMSSVLEQAMGGKQPKLIIVAVRRQHYTRIFKQQQDINGNDRAPQQNVMPGSCVRGVTSDDIVMVPHRALQGTAKPTIFTTLFPSIDELGVSVNLLKNVTHALCYMHEIVPSAISVPAPLRSAEQMAIRGKNIWNSKHGDLPPSQDLFVQATVALNPPINTRYWA